MADNFTITQGTGTIIATDQVGGAHYQKIKLIDPTADSVSPIGVAANPLAVDMVNEFPRLSFDGKGYACASIVQIPTIAETSWLLLKNTSLTKLVRIYEQILSIPDSASTVRSVLRIYKNPAVTVNGVAIPIGGLRNGQAASVMQAFSMPTVSANGTLVQVYGIINTPTQRPIALTRYIEPGDSILVTADCSSATELHAFTMSWAEV